MVIAGWWLPEFNFYDLRFFGISNGKQKIVLIKKQDSIMNLKLIFVLSDERNATQQMML